MTQRSSQIGAEIKQDKPFRSKSQEATVGLLRTVDTIKRFIGAAVEPAAVTLPQYNVLRILRGSGPRGLPTLEIGERMLERTPGITRMIDRLVNKGLVERVRCETDRRIVYCRIAPAGRAVVDGLDSAVDAADDRVLAALTPDQQQQLIDLLDAVRSDLDSCAGHGALAQPGEDHAQEDSRD